VAGNGGSDDVLAIVTLHPRVQSCKKTRRESARGAWSGGWTTFWRTNERHRPQIHCKWLRDRMVDARPEKMT